jgi:hypothetical protein
MENLFRPTNRFQDLYRVAPATDSLLGRKKTSKSIPELEFHGCEEDLVIVDSNSCSLSSFTTLKFVYDFVGDRIVWMGNGVFLCTKPIPNHYNILPRILSIHLDSSGSASQMQSIHVFAPTSEHATFACEFLFQCMARAPARNTYISEQYEQELSHVRIRSNDSLLSVSGPTLASFFTAINNSSKNTLQQVTLECLTLNQEHCRALMSATNPSLSLTLFLCTILEEGTDAFVECLQGDCGPTELFNCTLGVRALTKSLGGSSRRLRSLHVDRLTSFHDTDMAALVAALGANQGLTHFTFSNHAIGENNWNRLCQALKTHPSLESVNLQGTGDTSSASQNLEKVEGMYGEQKAFRMLALAEAIEENTVLHTLVLSPDETDDEIFEESIVPHLETNLFRPRVIAVKHAVRHPLSFRQKVLGRALQSISRNPNLLWCFLSENIDAAFGSTK